MSPCSPKRICSRSSCCMWAWTIDALRRDGHAQLAQPSEPLSELESSILVHIQGFRASSNRPQALSRITKSATMSVREERINRFPALDLADLQAEREDLSAVAANGRAAQLRRRRAMRGNVLRTSAIRSANSLRAMPASDGAMLNDHMSAQKKKIILRCGFAPSEVVDPSSSTSASSSRRPAPIHLPSSGKRKYDESFNSGSTSRPSNGCGQVLDYDAVPNSRLGIWTSMYPASVALLDTAYSHMLDDDESKRCCLGPSECGCSRDLCGCTAW